MFSVYFVVPFFTVLLCRFIASELRLTFFADLIEYLYYQHVMVIVLGLNCDTSFLMA